MSKTNLKLILSFVLIASVALIAIVAFAGCDNNNGNNNTSLDVGETVFTFVEKGDIGEGETAFRLEVTYGDEVKVWNVYTDETTVGDALFEAGLTDSASFITVIDGVTAEYVSDGYWWAFYIDGEMAMTAANAVDIDEDKTYAFICTPA